MKPEYKNSVPSPFQGKTPTKVPVLEEITRCIGIYNITAKIEEDIQTLSLFKHVPGLIAFICTLKEGDQIIGEGRGSAVLNKMNRFVDRGVRYAFNASLIDAMVRSTKTLDAIYLKTTQRKEVFTPTEENEEPDIEGRDRPAFYGDDDLPKFASEKQKNFLKKLVNQKCKDSTKKEYEDKLESPYLSSFQCSSLIKTLLTK